MKIDAIPKLQLRHEDAYYYDNRGHKWYYYNLLAHDMYVLCRDSSDRRNPLQFHRYAYRDEEDDICIESKHVKITEEWKLMLDLSFD